MNALLHSSVNLGNDLSVAPVLATRASTSMTVGGTVREIFGSSNCEDASQTWNFAEHVGQRVTEPASNDWTTRAKSLVVSFLNAGHFGPLPKESFRHGPGFIQV